MKQLEIVVALLLILLFAAIAYTDMSFSLWGAEVQGEVTSYRFVPAASTTARTEGGKPLHRGDYDYTFNVNGKQFGGRGTGWPVRKIGDSVTVQYIATDPDRNRPVNHVVYIFRFVYAVLLIGVFVLCFRKRLAYAKKRVE